MKIIPLAHKNGVQNLMGDPVPGGYEPQLPHHGLAPFFLKEAGIAIEQILLPETGMAVADGKIWGRSDNSDSVTAHPITGCGRFCPRKLSDNDGAFFRQGMEKGISFRLIYKLFKSGGGELQKFSQYNFADKPGLVGVPGSGFRGRGQGSGIGG
ncbi:MAG: hypothetical protein Q7I93_05315, partial [Syntrophales bacterium]|nr:hypothetical protein [Syntrophales bacterium]